MSTSVAALRSAGAAAPSRGVLADRLPIRALLIPLLTIVVFSDIVPQSLPEGQYGSWYGPTHRLYSFFFENLDTVIGVGALHFSATEVLFVALLLLIGARRLVGARIDRAGRLATANVLPALLALSLGALVLMELWGIARGGDFRQSLWQTRQLFWLPVLCMVFGHALRDERDFETALRCITAAACLKVVLGIYYLARVAWPAGMKAPMMTSHNDSVLFVVTLMGCVARWAHEPSWRRFRQTALIGGWLLLGIVLNNRRIAFVSLGGCLLALYFQLRGPLKRKANRLLVYCIPFLVPYLLAGRHHSGGIFKPAALVMSVSSQEDASSRTRDIENANLIYTLRANRLLGSGWGHEYIEVTKADDISRFFEQYRYIAHNSVLWLWSIGGWLGFTLIWLPLCAAIFFARRAYRFATQPSRRTDAVVILSAILAFMIQAWGDMGVVSLSNMLIAALAIAASAKLAVATGAFPARISLVRLSTSSTPATASISTGQWPVPASGRSP